jgi:hypothetical protein
MVRRPVVLPECLDKELADVAATEESTPSAQIVDAGEDAGNGGRFELPEVEVSEDRVRRVVVLDPVTNERLEEWAEAEQLDFSELTARLVHRALERKPQPA